MTTTTPLYTGHIITEHFTNTTKMKCLV